VVTEPAEPAVPAVAAELQAQLARIVGALRTTPRQRLRAASLGRFASRVDAGRALAVVLATTAQGIEEASTASMPSWRALPLLPDLAVGDQVAVTASDFVRAVAAAPVTVWTPSGRVELAEAVREVRALVAEVGALW
jgi:hypothetical protein